MEKCKNCEIIHNGSIIKVSEDGRCIFCGRKVGSSVPNNTKKEEKNKEEECKYCDSHDLKCPKNSSPQSPLSDTCPHGAEDKECPVQNCANFSSSNEDWALKKENHKWTGEWLKFIEGKKTAELPEDEYQELKLFISQQRLEAQRVVLEEILALTEHPEGYCLKQLDGFDIREYAETKGIVLPKITEE